MPLSDLEIVKQAEKRKSDSLRNSIVDGMAFSVMVGFGESLAVPFALALHANAFQVGLLTALPLLLGAVVQLAGAKILGITKNRQKIILPFVFLQAVMWAFIALVPFVFRENAVWILIAFYCIYIMFGQVVSPAWNSLMADLVSPKERGAYFGRRNAMTGLTALSATLAAGYFLNLYSKEALMFGFASMFFIAMAYRFISLAYLKKMHEPEYIWDEEKGDGLGHFIKTARKSNFGLFVLFMGFMNFSVFLSAPYFTPYMLGALRFDYLTFTIVNSAAALATILAMRRWGLTGDTFGNRRIIAITAFLISIVPVLWLFSSNPLYLIAAQLFSGLVWAGFTLAAANFLYDSVEPGKIAKYFAYQNIVIGVMAVLGALAGSYILDHATQKIWPSNYLFVFLVSTMLRLAAAGVFVTRIKEVRKVQLVSKRQLFFKFVTIRPPYGLVHEAAIIGKKISGLKSRMKI